ncbi:MAG: Rieske 2Fe-2S domain-containing protein [Sandaracinaceae bacterium]|nr:Rieske 2Fe-2S domain-containing protein [Sandaracinaceae bacterium]
MRKIDYPPYHVLVARVDGALHAIEDACPRQRLSPLCGHIEDGAVVCPAHLPGHKVDCPAVRRASAHRGGPRPVEPALRSPARRRRRRRHPRCLHAR